MNRHDRTQRLLANYDELDGQERRRVDQHMQQCEVCAQRFEDYGKLDRALVQLRRQDQLTLIQADRRLPAVEDLLIRRGRKQRGAWPDSLRFAAGRSFAGGLVVMSILFVVTLIGGIGLDRIDPIQVLTRPFVPTPTATSTEFSVRKDVTHTVQEGETVASIARKYDVTPQAIISANDLADPSITIVGDVLAIPGAWVPHLLVIRATTVRWGPGSDYPRFGTAEAGERYRVTGRDEMGRWWRIDYEGVSGWASSAGVDVKADSADVPIISVPIMVEEEPYAEYPPHLRSVQPRPGAELAQVSQVCAEFDLTARGTEEPSPFQAQLTVNGTELQVATVRQSQPDAISGDVSARSVVPVESEICWRFPASRGEQTVHLQYTIEDGRQYTYEWFFGVQTSAPTPTRNATATPVVGTVTIAGCEEDMVCVQGEWMVYTPDLPQPRAAIQAVSQGEEAFAVKLSRADGTEELLFEATGVYTSEQVIVSTSDPMTISVRASGPWRVSFTQAGRGGSDVDDASLPQDPPAYCPVTQPSVPSFMPPGFAEPPHEDEFWHGSEDLWTLLPVDGAWQNLPSGDGTYTQKTFWWREGYNWREEPEPELVVTGARLDAPAPALGRSPAANGYHPDRGSFMLAGVNFPEPGCWQITGLYSDQTLSFVVWIAP